LNISNLQVWSVIVTFNSDYSKLLALVSILLRQVEGIIIVDNGSDSKVIKSIQNLATQNSIDLILINENVGVAAAQNIGITRAKEKCARYVILFDHDSKPKEDMVEQLFSVMRQKELSGIKVAAIGPRYFDPRQNNPPPFIEVKGLRITRHLCKYEGIVPVSYLISSGSLISIDTLNSVGLMREDLFIDYVDIEWGLRAALKGYLSFGVCSAHMEHDLGDRPINFMGMTLPLHSPLRHYYLFRNAVWLYRQAHLPLYWKIGDAWRLFLKYGFYSLYGKPRLAHLKMMSKGIWHGLMGRVGKFQQ
jgi:rhamnosyltransferase